MKIRNAIEGFLTDWQLRNRSPTTIRVYRSCLMVLQRWLGSQGIEDVEDITIHHLRAFMLETQNRPAGSVNPRRPPSEDEHTPMSNTLRLYVKVIKVIFNWLVAEEVIVKNPALRLAQPTVEQKLRATFTPLHLQAMFDACDLNSSLGFRDYALMLVLLDTGLRASEVCSLTLDDMHEGYLKVHGKGNKEREAGISPVTSKYLWKYVNQYRTVKSDAIRELC
jgi:site-specific recombinase XerD